MALIQTKLPLFDDPFYSYSTSLEQNTFYLEFLYLQRIDDWVISVTDAERNKLVTGQRLTPNKPLFLDYRLPNLTGYFFLTPKSSEDPSVYDDRKRRLKDYFNFYYYYDDGDN